MLRISTRPMEVLDFIGLKKVLPFSFWRQTAKTINFSMIFSCTPASFATRLENKGFSEQDCDEYISLTNNLEFYNALLEQKQDKMTPKKVKYLAVATLLRNAFFDTYKGYGLRITREQNFAREHGYVRSWHGPVRHLPEMRYFRTDKRGNLVGADKEMWGKLYSREKNAACNTGIQTLEARIALPSIVWIDYYLEKWNFYSRVWNNVHDSIDAFILDEELQVVAALIDEICGTPREPVYGIPMSADGEISRATDEAYEAGEMYHTGIDIKPVPLAEAIDAYNACHPNMHISYEGIKS